MGHLKNTVEIDVIDFQNENLHMYCDNFSV